MMVQTTPFLQPALLLDCSTQRHKPLSNGTYQLSYMRLSPVVSDITKATSTIDGCATFANWIRSYLPVLKADSSIDSIASL